jgi:hypothetical protein
MDRSSSPRRVLVVADEACDDGGLCGLVRERAGEDADVVVVAPALTRSRLRFWVSDTDGARRQAERRLGATIASLEALGVEARGSVGDPDPVQAVEDALRGFAADEVLVYAHHTEASSWLERDVVAKLRERHGVPVERIVVGAHTMPET